MRAKIVEALGACGGGPMNASTLRVAAFGGARINAVMYADVLRNLVRVGVIRSRWVSHWVGRRGCEVFELAPTVTRSQPTTDAKLANVIAYLDGLDRISVLDVIQREVIRARESGDQDDEGRWLRIAFAVSRVFDPDEATDDEAAS
jgi:hypothetical protein